MAKKATQASVKNAMLKALAEAGRAIPISTLTLKVRSAFPSAAAATVDKLVLHWIQEAAKDRGPFLLTDNLRVARHPTRTTTMKLATPTRKSVKDAMLSALINAGRAMAISTLTLQVRAAFPNAAAATVDKHVLHWIQEAANNRGPFRLTAKLLVARRN